MRYVRRVLLPLLIFTAGLTLGMGANRAADRQSADTGATAMPTSPQLPAVEPPQEMPVSGPATVSVEQIEAVLASYGSPAAGSGQIMIDLGSKYGIDPAFCLAFFIHESAAGTRGVATVTKSVGNIRWTPHSGFPEYRGFRLYSSWEAGIEDWYRLIRELYIDTWGLTTIEQIVPVYAPATDNNDTARYIQTIRQLVSRWRSAE